MKKIRVFGLVLSVIALAAFLASCSNPAGPNGNRPSTGVEYCDTCGDADCNDPNCGVDICDTCGYPVVLPDADIKIGYGVTTNGNRLGPLVICNPMGITYTRTWHGGLQPGPFLALWSIRFYLPPGVTDVKICYRLLSDDYRIVRIERDEGANTKTLFICRFF